MTEVVCQDWETYSIGEAHYELDDDGRSEQILEDGQVHADGAKEGGAGQSLSYLQGQREDPANFEVARI